MALAFDDRSVRQISASKELQESLSRYGTWLAATSSKVENVNLYKNQRTQKFVDLCKFHLSLMVDLPMDFSEYSPDLSSPFDGMPKQKKYRSWAKLSQGNKYEIQKSDWTEGSIGIYYSAMALIEHLSTGDNLKTEMIFRKAGNISRQRELIKHLTNASNVVYPVRLEALNASASSIPPSPVSSFFRSRMMLSGRSKVAAVESQVIPQSVEEFTAHDYANALKTVLRETAHPILTQDLLPVYTSVSKLTSGNCDDAGSIVPLTPNSFRLARSKQILSLRILRFLLPVRNQILLRGLLDLLTDTLRYSSINGMSAESLGTIFGPLLFAPSCHSSTNLHKEYSALNDLATLMIKQGSKGVFAVPLILANDVDRNLSSEGLLSSLSASKHSDVYMHMEVSSTYDDDAALHTNLAFAEKRSVREEGESWKELTKVALSELSAAVSELPDSHPKRSRYIRRLSNIYGGRNRNPLHGNIESNSRSCLVSPAASTKQFLPDCSEGVASKFINLRTPATLSSTSLDGSQVPCCPLAGILPSIKRRQPCVATPLRKVLENAMPLSVGDKDLPQNESICSTPKIRRVFVPATAIVWTSRRYSCMRKMPVRRNYRLNKLDKQDSLPIQEINARKRSSI